MLTRCLHWDLRKVTRTASDLSQQLNRLSHEEALLVTSRTSFPEEWRRGRLLTLLGGPSLYQQLYLAEAPSDSLELTERRREHAQWPQLFAKLRAEALRKEDTSPGRTRLENSIKYHLDWEERQLFPALKEFLGDDRYVRDLGYEHTGIRRLLPGLAVALAQAYDKRAWERFSLDLIHLLEHHIEHEERAAYPLYEQLARCRTGVSKNEVGPR